MKNLSLIFIFIMTIVSCSKNDDSTGGNVFENVPSGEIVATSLRSSVLTGFDNANPAGRLMNTQKWWKHNKSVVDYGSNCGEEDEQIVHNDIYIAFYPTGEVYTKSGVNGQAVNTNYTWSWVDVTTKNKIYFNGLEYTFTELWNSRLVIASNQSQQGCSVIIWEEWTNN